ncbi:MAG: arylsulfatase A [Cyclobacteriaceae bacterium]|jgi:arylsulfatase A
MMHLQHLLTSFTICVTFSMVISCSDESVSDQKPNVIILYADDMGYGDLAIQNTDSKIPTPNLDRLAKQGMRFTDGHSSSGICTPSRYGMLTGRHHWRDFHGIVGAMGKPFFKEKQYTFAQMAKDNGYATACIGKWHLGWDWEAIRKPEWTQQDSMKLWGRYHKFYPSEAYDWGLPIPDGPLERGFDYYYGDGTINFPPYAWVENDRVTKTPTVSMTTPEGLALEGSWEARPGPAVEGWDFFKVLPTLVEKAVAYIESQKGSEKPFFLYMAFPSPHAPIIPNEEYRGKSKAGSYGDFVYQTDWCAGEILKALEAIGATKNTIVIFTADNGPERYAYDRIRNFNHHSSAPFRGLKRDIYEGGHRVPFVVRWPDKIEAGSISDEVISQVDILKTISQLIGADLPKGLAHDSHDFSDVWLGKDEESNIREATVQNTFKDRYAIRVGDWLYINHESGYHSKPPEWEADYFGYPTLSDSVQLYNLKEDLSQKYNLASEMSERVNQMQKRLEDIRQAETFIE